MGEVRKKGAGSRVNCRWSQDHRGGPWMSDGWGQDLRDR